MTAYPYSERDIAYSAIEEITNITNAVEKIGLGQRSGDPELQLAIANMTGASDLHQQFKALQYLRDKTKESHRKKILAAAPNDFTAFVEVINEEEACRSKVHRFLGETLMEMDSNPDMRTAVSMPPGHAKDLCVSTPVLMGDGSSKRLGDVNAGDMVITHTGMSREVIRVHNQGIREMVLIKTLHGREIKAHPDHPFLTPSGWIPIKDLVAGDVLAQQREFSIPNTSDRSATEFALAGYMMAFGMIRGRVYSRLTTVENTFRTDDPKIIEDVRTLAKNLGFDSSVTFGEQYGQTVRTITFSEGFQFWLEAQGLWKLKRNQMRIPDWVFKGGYGEIGAFVGAIMSMDGTMVPQRSEHTGAQRILKFVLRNTGLTKDLRRLIMRMGARATYSEQYQRNYNYTPTTFNNLVIQFDEDILFLKRGLRIVGQNSRFWSNHLPVRRFFDNRYAEDKILSIEPIEEGQTKCLTVDEDSSFLADGIIVHNSTYCSRLFPAWWMGKREGKKWLQAGHTQRFTEKEFGKKLKDNIILTDGYRKLFDVTIKSAALDEIELTNGCTYVCKGVGQGISGFRSNFNNIDDPYPTEAKAQSAGYREDVWDWWTNDFRTRRLPGSGELIIVTRWHSDDIVGRLEDMIQEQQIKEDWNIINLPAYCVDENHDQLRRKKGDVLWPEYFTKTFLEGIRAPMEESRWESLYQGSPSLADGNILKRDWIKYYDKLPQIGRNTQDLSVNQSIDARLSRRNTIGGPDKIHDGDPKDSKQGDPRDSNRGPLESNSDNPVRIKRIVVSVDSAETSTARSDYTAIQVWALGDDKKHYLLEAFRDKLDFPDLVIRVEAMAKKWEADIILCETKGAGNQYIQARQGHAPCSIIGYNPGRDDKATRFDGTMVLWQAGDVLLPQRAPWLLAYIDELLRFPTGKNDDHVDATSQYLNWARGDGGWKRGTKKLGR